MKKAQKPKPLKVPEEPRPKWRIKTPGKFGKKK